MEGIMEFLFTFESNAFSKDGETCDTIEVTCNKDQETEVVCLYNVSQEFEVKIEDFPMSEQVHIEQLAARYGDEKSPDVADQADHLYERTRDYALETKE
jgi:hypothetical protein